MAFSTTSIAHLYPFESRWFDCNGQTMHYVDEGRGKVVVCVHGNPSWSFLFRGVISGLRDRYRVVAPDHIGCGLSARPKREEYPFTLERRVSDFRLFMDHVCPSDPVTLLVHDWGGLIGLAWAVRNPARVQSLIITNTAAFPMPAGKRVPWMLSFVRRSGPVAAILIQGFNAFARGTLWVGCSRPVTPDVRRGYLGPYDSWRNRLATLLFVKDIPATPLDSSYPALLEVAEGLKQFRDTPALVCWGMKDPVFDPDYLAEWRNRLPQAQVVQFGDAGHYLFEDAGDAIMAPIIKHLDRLAGRTHD
ncbi:MAG: alpha/beta fold hydrolase [Candidatus Sumerlaeaceae bacterium]|nr:alpha/beta fold hydrolase [Candidatus Sumerlaeaceae bacterium]